MRKRLSLVGLYLAIMATCGPMVRADSALHILENQHTVRFAERMAFRLVAEHEQRIRGVTLYYRRQREPVTSRVVPEFTPGTRVEATFEKTVERGEIPPGTTIEYFWRLELADGTRLDTPTQTFVYQDDRFAWQTRQANRVTIFFYGDRRDEALAQARQR